MQHNSFSLTTQLTLRFVRGILTAALILGLPGTILAADPQIESTVTTTVATYQVLSNGKPVVGSITISADNKNDPNLSQTVTADSTGLFSFKATAPGQNNTDFFSYKLTFPNNETASFAIVGGKNTITPLSSDLTFTNASINPTTTTTPTAPIVNGSTIGTPTSNSDLLRSTLNLGNPTPFGTVKDFIAYIPRVLFYFIGVASLFGFLVGAYTYFVSDGKEDMLEKGKAQMVGSIIALIIVLSAAAIVAGASQFAKTANTSSLITK